MGPEFAAESKQLTLDKLTELVFTPDSNSRIFLCEIVGERKSNSYLDPLIPDDCDRVSMVLTKLDDFTEEKINRDMELAVGDLPLGDKLLLHLLTNGRLKTDPTRQIFLIASDGKLSLTSGSDRN